MHFYVTYLQGKLEARLIERGGQFFVGNNLTWADLHVFAVLDRLRVDNPEVGLQNVNNPSTFIFRSLGNFSAFG